jgi:hypothetical protein
MKLSNHVMLVPSPCKPVIDAIRLPLHARGQALSKAFSRPAAPVNNRLFYRGFLMRKWDLLSRKKAEVARP